MASPDPIQLFLRYWKEAREKADPVADALSLATADAAGHPHVRTVLLKQVPDGRFGFVSRVGGKKHEHIAHQNDIECCTHWPTLNLQVRLRCKTETMDKESLGYFWSLRPRDAQIVYSMDFRQSEEISSFQNLTEQFEKIKKQFQKIKAIPLSKFYVGYFLKPYSIEFLYPQKSRLNQRQLYILEDGQWLQKFLAP